jgi:hypothetical protein
MHLAIGTEKGGYIIDGEGAVSGPLFPGWKVSSFGRTPDGNYLAGLGSNWFGAAVHRSPDLKDWTQIENGPTYGESRPLNQMWTFHTVGDRIWAGVAEAGLFFSDDGGDSWQPVEGLNEHRTRPEWQPGFGGLCAHRILTKGETMWVGISAVGVFRSDDGGETWELKNDGVPAAGVPDDSPRPEVGYCVHNLDHDPDDPQRMWRQDHMGVFRSYDGGDSWERIESGLPAGFGFVMRRDHASGRLFVLPLEADVNRVPIEGRFGAYLSEDGGDSWVPAGTGWPDAPTYTSVLRGAVAADGDGRIALGTTGGKVWLTEDAGDTWRELTPTFPRIEAVAIF